jgi:hypothetical protein
VHNCYYNRDLTLGMNRVQYRTNYVRNTHNPYCTLISLCMCILNLEGNQMKFDLQIRQVPDQTFPPYWRGDPITALASCAFIQIFVCKEVLNTCCLNVASQGGSLIKLESTCGQFNEEPVFPFGSYRRQPNHLCLREISLISH